MEARLEKATPDQKKKHSKLLADLGAATADDTLRDIAAPTIMAAALNLGIDGMRELRDFLSEEIAKIEAGSKGG